MDTTIVTVPGRFYEDHVDRELPAGEVVFRYKGGRAYKVRLTAEERAEILSDAEYYAGLAGEVDPYLKGLVLSARATVRALK